MLPKAAPSSKVGLGARRLTSLLALALIAIGCGDGDGDARPSDDSSLPPVSDDSCARFGFTFTDGGCPELECAQPLCSCPTPVGCISGMNQRCMTGVDCVAACAIDPTTLFVCSVSIDPCHDDGDCPTGRCVIESAASNGECESGERGARCRNDQDCLLGNCVAGTAGNRACSPGEPGDLCNRDRDCQREHCLLMDRALTGECE
jgi:hypothetical protein